MTLTAQDMCYQIARYLDRQTGDLFVEPTSIEPGSIYAVALPSKMNRLNPAVSIVPLPSATDEAMQLTERFAMVMHAQGDSNLITMQKLGQYQKVLWPFNRPNIPVEDPHAPGIVGVPSDVGTHPVWRIIEIRQLDHPRPNPRTPDGFSSAEFAFEIHAIETTATVAI